MNCSEFEISEQEAMQHPVNSQNISVHTESNSMIVRKEVYLGIISSQNRPKLQ